MMLLTFVSTGRVQMVVFHWMLGTDDRAARFLKEVTMAAQACP